MNCTIKNSIINEFKLLTRTIAKQPYTKFIEGKTVSIVGPAEIILNREKKEEIDASDVIIRINTAIDFMQFSIELSKYIGTRTDVLYLAPSELHKTCKSEHRINTIRTEGIKYIILQSFFNHGEYIIDKSNAQYCRLIKNQLMLSQLLSTSVVYVFLGKDVGLVLSNALSSINSKNIMGRMGFFSIVDCLMRNAKSVTVYGMTFYFGGGHIFRKDCVGELKPDKRHDGKESVHDSRSELQLLNTIFQDKVIFVND